MQLGFVGTLAEDGENDINPDFEESGDQSGVNNLNRLVSGEILELEGRDEVESVTSLDGVGEIGIRDTISIVDGIAGACNWNKQGLTWDERRRWRGDVAGI